MTLSKLLSQQQQQLVLFKVLWCKKKIKHLTIQTCGLVGEEKVSVWRYLISVFTVQSIVNALTPEESARQNMERGAAEHHPSPSS